MNKEILKSILEEYDMKNNKDKVIDEFLNDFDMMFKTIQKCK